MLNKRFCVLCASLIVLFSAPAAYCAEWTWNGYFAADYKDQTKVGDPSDFDAYVFSIISNIAVNESTKLVAQVDWEHAPYFEATGNVASKTLDKRTSGELTLSNAYVQYNLADYLKVNAGKFFVPIGFYNQITYVLPAFPTLRIPVESVYKKGSTPQTDDIFFQRYGMGVWLGGSYPILGGNLSYDAYISNGRAAIQHQDSNDHKAVGGRIKYGISVLGMEITPIISYYTDQYYDEATTATTDPQIKQSTLMPGGEISAGNLVIKGEYANTTRKDSVSIDEKGYAYYVEAYYTLLEKYTPYVRYENYNPENQTLDANDTTLGITYHLQPWLSQIKAQVRIHKDQTSSPYYNEYGIGVALGF